MTGRAGSPGSAPRAPRGRDLARSFAALATPVVALALAGAIAIAAREIARNAYLPGHPLLALDALRVELDRTLAFAFAAAALAAPVLALLERRGLASRAVRLAALQAVGLPVLLSVLFAAEWRVDQDQLRGHALPRALLRRELLAGAFCWAALCGALALVRARRSAGKAQPSFFFAAPRAALAVALVTALLWLGVRAGRAVLAPSRADAPSVIYVTWDSVRADHVSAYGHAHPTTPHLDAFAAEAVLFEQAISQHNWTRPSYASILTGRANHELGGPGMPPAVTTLAELLRDAGYRTLAWVGNPNLDARFGFDQGFDEYVHVLGTSASEALNGFVLPRLRALARSGEPFFAFVHYQEPHWPYRPLPGEGKPPLDASTLRKLMTDHGADWAPPAEEEAAALDFLHRSYDADLRATDLALGELLAALREVGLLERSLVILNSDHGDEFRDHGGFGHGHPNVHPELTWVPMVMRFPDALGVPAMRVDAVVRSLDLLPTVLEVVGLEAPPGLRGRSLLPLERLAAEPRIGVSQWGGLVRVRIGDRSVHLDHRDGEAVVTYFDLAVDPGEQRPLDPSQAAEFAPLREAAFAWYADYQKAGGGGEGAAGAAQERPIDQELRERLRALGYVE